MNPTQQRIVDVLQKKMTNKNVSFFSNLALYKMAQVASNMGATVSFVGGKKIPTNVYALSLATSGFSKGRSLKFLETEIFNQFRTEFVNHTLIVRSRAVIEALAEENAIISGKDVSHEEQNLWKTVTALPKFIYTFGSGSTPEGLRGLMTALSLRNTGAVTLEIDEIGSSITSNKDVLDNMLMSYDGGLIKNKLKKTDSNDDILNPVPTNLMAFGTPSKLFDGGTSEEMLMDFLDTGYGRRFIYAYADDVPEIMSAADKMLQLMDKSVDDEAEKLSNEIKILANTKYYGVDAELTDEANVALFEYEESCLKRSAKLKSYQEIEKTELEHRYFRVLKISGVYAFMETSKTVTLEMVNDAIELVELSGESFKKLMTREKNFVRLAKYIAEQGSSPVTLAELTHDLSGFFKGSENAKREMLTLAKSWAAGNDVIIKENIVSDVSYFTGEMIENTSMDSLIVSASAKLADGYADHYARWEKFPQVLDSNLNICTHHFEENYRDANHAKLPMNLMVLDVDEGVSIKLARKLLEDYTYIMYTTKRHTETHNRFRIIMPMSKIIKLNEQEHKLFYQNIYDWLPFEVDSATGDIARKWQCYKGCTQYSNDGIMFDPTMMIPGTTKAKKTSDMILSYGSDTTKLERHIFMNTEGRSNALIKIAMVHVDRGLDYDTIYSLVSGSNSKLDVPLDDREMTSTIFKTVAKKIGERDGA